MKASKFFLAVAMVAMALPASAQFTGSHRNNNRGGKAAKVAADCPATYNNLSVGYNADFFKFDKDSETGNGFAAQYMHGWHITDMPLYIEAGARFAMSFYSTDEGFGGNWDPDDFDWDDNDWDDWYRGYDDYDYGYGEGDEKTKYTYMYLAIPVNLGYRFQINEGMSLMPYAGLNAKFNLVAKSKTGDYKCDMFDKKDMGGSDYTANRFQIGMQIGARMNFNQLSVGLEYGYDFSELMKKCNTSHLAVNVGFNF